MANVKIKNREFILNGKGTFVFAGEIHYYRIPAKEWPDRLKKAVEAGFNTVTSYIPWDWHEYEEGKFDFSGRTCPERNILKYIKEVEKAGLYFIARVGPVANAEMAWEGLPGWLLRDYPDVRAKTSDGGFFHHGKLVSYLNPKFQKFVDAKKW